MHCRELLWTLTDAELNLLEKSLCSTDDVDRSSTMLAELSGVPPELLLSYDCPPPSEFYTDDLSDTDEGATCEGVMVHSESTMTVVARPISDEVAATSNSSSSPSSVGISDAEARRLQHSKSWPQSADSHRVADGVTTSAITVYGNQRFNFNLPFNTSIECVYADDGSRSSGGSGIIYLPSPVPSVGDQPQIAYVTDELCRIFCTDTASLEDDSSDVATEADFTESDVLSEDRDAPSDDVLISNNSELAASLQQHCLPVIVCECNSSENAAVAVASVSSSPTSTEESSLTVTFSPPESSADVVSTASNEPESFPSSSELPFTELPATLVDDSTGSFAPPSSSDVMVSANISSAAVALEDVVLSASPASCDDVTESTVAGRISASDTSVGAGDVKSIVTASEDISSSRHHSKRSSPMAVIETDTAAKIDSPKSHNLSQTWSYPSASVELGHDRER